MVPFICTTIHIKNQLVYISQLFLCATLQLCNKIKRKKKNVKHTEMTQGLLQPKQPNHFVSSISDPTPMVHQLSNKYPLRHLQTLPPLLLLPSPASPQIRRPLTSPSSPPLARLTSVAPTPHLPSSSWPAQATGGAPFHDSSDVAPAPRRSEPGEEVPLGAGTTPSCCRNRWIRGRGLILVDFVQTLIPFPFPVF